MLRSTLGSFFSQATTTLFSRGRSFNLLSRSTREIVSPCWGQGEIPALAGQKEAAPGSLACLARRETQHPRAPAVPTGRELSFGGE